MSPDETHPDYLLIHMSMLPNSVEYLDPLVYRTFPMTTIKGALPRRLNPNYKKPPSYIKRFFNWLLKKDEKAGVKIVAECCWCYEEGKAMHDERICIDCIENHFPKTPRNK